MICAGNDKIINRIFKGSNTLDNIIREKEFTVNITHDSELFTLLTLGNLPRIISMKITQLKQLKLISNVKSQN